MKTSLHHIITVALTTAFAATIATSAAQSSDWPHYLFDDGHSSHNALATAITPANASTLVEDWSFIDPQPTIEGQPIASFYSSPTVFKGVVYIGSNTGNFYALDEATGAVLWQQLLGYTTPTNLWVGAWRHFHRHVGDRPCFGSAHRLCGRRRWVSLRAGRCDREYRV